LRLCGISGVTGKDASKRKHKNQNTGGTPGKACGIVDFVPGSEAGNPVNIQI